MNIKVNEYILLRIRETAAIFLWDYGAIKINLDEPFKLVSGNYSPIYINCRLVISNPTIMRLFTSFAQIICDRKDIRKDIVAGGETAGIPFAAYIAQSLSLPMIYVRKSKKGHGIASLVEGRISDNARVILVEDLITDGRSKLSFIDAICESGGIVKDVLVFFDRLQGGCEVLEARGIRLHSVTDMNIALTVAKDSKFVQVSHLESVQEYLENPRVWSEKHHLPFKD